MVVNNYSKCDFLNHINDILNQCASDSNRFSDDVIVISTYNNILRMTEMLKEQRTIVDVQDFIRYRIKESIVVLVIAQDIRTAYIESPCFSNGEVKDFIAYYVLGDDNVIRDDSLLFRKNRCRHGCVGGEIYHA